MSVAEENPFAFLMVSDDHYVRLVHSIAGATVGFLGEFQIDEATNKRSPPPAIQITAKNLHDSLQVMAAPIAQCQRALDDEPGNEDPIQGARARETVLIGRLLRLPVTWCFYFTTQRTLRETFRFLYDRMEKWTKGSEQKEAQTMVLDWARAAMTAEIAEKTTEGGKSLLTDGSQDTGTYVRSCLSFQHGPPIQCTPVFLEWAERNMRAFFPPPSTREKVTEPRTSTGDIYVHPWRLAKFLISGRKGAVGCVFRCVGV